MDDIRRIAKDIDGWLTDAEGELLHKLAKNCKGKGVIVEIGSWKGKSTVYLANGSKAGNNVRVYAIDPHTGGPDLKRLGKVWSFEEFKRNVAMAGVDDIVVPMIKTSEEAAKGFDQPIELIFIDGAHEYEMVKLDFNLWFPKVIDGGIMAFHDTKGRVGPTKVVKEYVYKSRNFRGVEFVDTITFAKKSRTNSIRDRVRNRYVLLLRIVYISTAKLPLPSLIRVFGRKVMKWIK